MAPVSNVWVIVRDDNDGAGGSEVLGVYTVDALALATVEELNRAAAGSGAAERFRAVRVGLNSHDKLPGQWAESSIEVMRGVFVESWTVEDYVPLAALRLHRPEWQPWPTVAGDSGPCPP